MFEAGYNTLAGLIDRNQLDSMYGALEKDMEGLTYSEIDKEKNDANMASIEAINDHGKLLKLIKVLKIKNKKKQKYCFGRVFEDAKEKKDVIGEIGDVITSKGKVDGNLDFSLQDA